MEQTYASHPLCRLTVQAGCLPRYDRQQELRLIQRDLWDKLRAAILRTSRAVAQTLPPGTAVCSKMSHPHKKRRRSDPKPWGGPAVVLASEKYEYILAKPMHLRRDTLWRFHLLDHRATLLASALAEPPSDRPHSASASSKTMTELKASWPCRYASSHPCAPEVHRRNPMSPLLWTYGNILRFRSSREARAIADLRRLPRLKRSRGVHVQQSRKAGDLSVVKNHTASLPSTPQPKYKERLVGEVLSRRVSLRTPQLHVPHRKIGLRMCMRVCLCAFWCSWSS